MDDRRGKEICFWRFGCFEDWFLKESSLNVFIEIFSNIFIEGDVLNLEDIKQEV